MVQLERDVANEIEEDILRKLSTMLQVPEFAPGGVPVKVAAKVFGKGEEYVRDGIEAGRLPIGCATREKGKMRCNVYISPKLLWEYTGFVWRGEESLEKEN